MPPGAAAGVDLAEAQGAGAADDQAVHLRLQPRRGPARRRRRCTRRLRDARRAGRRGVPQRQARDGPHGHGARRGARAAPELRRRGVRARPARPHRLPHPRAADLPHGRPQGVARLDDRPGLDRPAGRRRHPHRLPARLHQGRGRLASTTSSRPARWPPPRRPARSASRARTTSWPTATSWSSASTCRAAGRACQWEQGRSYRPLTSGESTECRPADGG